jgi:hypothetical protein
MKIKSLTLERLVLFLADGGGSITVSRSPVGGAWQVDAARRVVVGYGDIGRMVNDAGPWCSGDVTTTTRISAHGSFDLDAAINGALDGVKRADAKWCARGQSPSAGTEGDANEG